MGVEDCNCNAAEAVLQGRHVGGHEPAKSRGARDSDVSFHDEPKTRNARSKPGVWWALQGLNLRLIPCEGITLPLS